MTPDLFWVAVYLYLILLAWFCIAFSQTLIYIFQIKEYRFDRLISQIKESGISILTSNFGKRGAVTVRNSIIGILSIGLFVLFNLTTSLLLFHITATPPRPCYHPENPLLCDGAGSGLGLRIPGLNAQNFIYLGVIYLFIVETIITNVSVVIAVLLSEPFAQYKRKRLIAQATNKVKPSKAFFIGISGTYGKSTTKEYLYHILSTKFKVGKTDANMNTDVGVAISILRNLQSDTEYFVAEVGAYKLGEVRRAANIFSPRAAIMLPFGNQHMDLFGSKENLVASESELVELTPPDGTVYVSADIPELEYVKNHTKSKLVTYSVNKEADISATGIKATEKGSSANVAYNKVSVNISTKLLGKHIIQNLLPAIAFAADQGMTAKEIAAAITTLEPVEGKLSVSEKNGAIILNDSGNSSLDGFIAAINTIKLFNRPNIFILSKGIRELGKEKNESYKKIIMQINKEHMQLATDDRLFKSFDNDRIVTIVRNEEEFYKYIVAKLDAKAAVLIEGKFTKPFIQKLI